MIESRSSPQRGPPPPQAKQPTAAEKARWEKIQKQLDDALANTFPASDPVSIVTPHDEEDRGQPESK